MGTVLVVVLILTIGQTLYCCWRKNDFDEGDGDADKEDNTLSLGTTGCFIDDHGDYDDDIEFQGFAAAGNRFPGWLFG